ncbi:hypothetical protein E2C01_054420 [Portunus trituberculatus]|uniref:Uncharacterized protein n=1 Tax=Portunus trituberculatus TaxID=210409 RepID=A0A5B7GRX4_PORTR|nr:hypothetical protein [Portunus trituberculatus]
MELYHATTANASRWTDEWVRKRTSVSGRSTEVMEGRVFDVLKANSRSSDVSIKGDSENKIKSAPISRPLLPKAQKEGKNATS